MRLTKYVTRWFALYLGLAVGSAITAHDPPLVICALVGVACGVPLVLADRAERKAAALAAKGVK